MSVESELYSLPNLMPTVYDFALLLNWIMFQLQEGGGGGGGGMKGYRCITIHR